MLEYISNLLTSILQSVEGLFSNVILNTPSKEQVESIRFFKADTKKLAILRPVVFSKGNYGRGFDSTQQYSIGWGRITGSSVDDKSTVTLQATDPERGEGFSSDLKPIWISGQPASGRGPLDELIYNRNYRINDPSEMRFITEITEICNIYVRKYPSYNDTDAERAFNTIARKIISKDLVRKEFQDTLLCVGLDMGMGKSYLTKKYPQIFLDIDDLMNWRSEKIARLFNFFDPQNMDKINWDLVSRQTGLNIAEYQKTLPFTTHRILLMHNHDCLVHAANLMPGKRIIYFGTVGLDEKTYNEVVDIRLREYSGTGKEYMRKMFPINRLTSKSAKIGRAHV